MPGLRPFLALARALLPRREPERILDWSKGDIDDECERLARRLLQDGAAHLGFPPQPRYDAIGFQVVCVPSAEH